ncbi:hypothetical protein GE061_018173 [Apolygus lucorum]|uniref:Uncharacterized protein n=1 Tax=Apolygus lucorum TaxID=248454 RepID=A0A6A4JG94_APOLU|nr:hypothetical protein GE061_018173 [Apolygus lucorum]
MGDRVKYGAYEDYYYSRFGDVQINPLNRVLVRATYICRSSYYKLCGRCCGHEPVERKNERERRGVETQTSPVSQGYDPLTKQEPSWWTRGSTRSRSASSKKSKSEASPKGSKNEASPKGSKNEATQKGSTASSTLKDLDKDSHSRGSKADHGSKSEDPPEHTGMLRRFTEHVYLFLFGKGTKQHRKPSMTEGTAQTGSKSKSPTVELPKKESPSGSLKIQPTTEAGVKVSKTEQQESNFEIIPKVSKAEDPPSATSTHSNPKVSKSEEQPSPSKTEVGTKLSKTDGSLKG